MKPTAVHRCLAVSCITRDVSTSRCRECRIPDNTELSPNAPSTFCIPRGQHSRGRILARPLGQLRRDSVGVLRYFLSSAARNGAVPLEIPRDKRKCEARVQNFKITLRSLLAIGKLFRKNRVLYKRIGNFFCYWRRKMLTRTILVGRFLANWLAFSWLRNFSKRSFVSFNKFVRVNIL